MDCSGGFCCWEGASFGVLCGSGDRLVLARGFDDCRRVVCCDELLRIEALGSLVGLIEVCCELVWSIILPRDDEREVVDCCVRLGPTRIVCRVASARYDETLFDLVVFVRCGLASV